MLSQAQYTNVAAFSNAVPDPGILVTPASWAAFKTAVAAGLGAGGFTTYNVVDLRGIATVAPDVVTFDTTYPAPGIIVVANPNQICRIVLTARAHNIRFIGAWNIQADVVQNNVVEGPDNYGVHAAGASNFSFEGAYCQNNLNAFWFNGSQVFTVKNALITNFRDNGMVMSSFSFQQCKQGQIVTSKFRESLYYPKVYYSITGASPSFIVDPGAGYILQDSNHIDAIQFYFDTNGALLNTSILANDIAGRMQGIFITDGAVVNIEVSNNNASISEQWPIRVDAVSNGTYLSNTCSFFSDPNPTVTSTKMLTTSASGTGPMWGGLNVFGTGMTGDTGGYAMNLTAAPNGTPSTLPINPGYAGFNTNVVNIAALTVQPVYVPYAGPVVAYPNSIPQILGPGGPFLSAYTQGDYLTAYPPTVRGYYFGVEVTYYTRWRNVDTNTLLQASTIGAAGMVYHATAAANIRPEWSADNVTFINGPTTTVVPLAPAVTWSSVYKQADITLSLSDLKATNGVDFGTLDPKPRCVMGTAFIATNGDRYWVATPVYSSGNAEQLGFANVTQSLNLMLDSSPNAVAVAKDGTVQLNGAYKGATNAINSGDTVILFVRLSGSPDGTTKKMYISINGVWQTLGGDPTAGGAGIDISAIAGAIAPAWGCYYHIGENVTADFTHYI